MMRRIQTILIALAIGAAMAVPAAALADLYRWRDPESGSMRYSNVAPPWFGENAQVRGPAVEVIAAPKPVVAAADKINGAEVPRAGRATVAPRPLPEFDGRRRALLDRLASAQNLASAEAGMREMQAAMTAYRDLVAQMDRIDPQGASARHALDQPLLQRIGESFARRFGTAGGSGATLSASGAPASPAPAASTTAPAR